MDESWRSAKTYHWVDQRLFKDSRNRDVKIYNKSLHYVEPAKEGEGLIFKNKNDDYVFNFLVISVMVNPDLSTTGGEKAAIEATWETVAKELIELVPVEDRAQQVKLFNDMVRKFNGEMEKKFDNAPKLAELQTPPTESTSGQQDAGQVAKMEAVLRKYLNAFIEVGNKANELMYDPIEDDAADLVNIIDDTQDLARVLNETGPNTIDTALRLIIEKLEAIQENAAELRRKHPSDMTLDGILDEIDVIIGNVED